MEVLLIAALVLLNGYFAAAEIALISARRAALAHAAEEGSAGAQAALHLTEDPSRLLATIQIGITLVGFMASAAAAVALAEPLAEWLGSLGSPWLAGIAGGLSVVLVRWSLRISRWSSVSSHRSVWDFSVPSAWRYGVSRPVSIMATAVSPLVWLLARSTDVVARLLGVVPGQGRPGVSEEEIKLLVTEQGSLLDEEKRMIHEIFELGDTVVREIMVPESIWSSSTEEAQLTMRSWRFVHRASPDFRYQMMIPIRSLACCC